MLKNKLSIIFWRNLLSWTLVLSMNLGIISALLVKHFEVKAATSNLTLNSSSQYLMDAFNWAKPMALSKVQLTGVYQAALQNRPVFCMRDWSHQVDGAHLLGLDSGNYIMLNDYALLQTSGRNWYSIWEVNYDGSISSIDYVSDTNFWRNLSGMFDVVDKAYRQYQWTADSNLLNNSTLNSFYSHTLNEFITQHDGNENGIAEEHSNNGWVGVSSYNEGPDYTLTESADGLANQYKAFLGYSKILEAKGDIAGSTTWKTKATNLKNTFNSNWYSSKDGRFIRGFTDGAYAPVTNFGYESSWFIPLKEISNPGTNATNYLDFIYNSFNANPSPNIEAWTYLPDVFYTWNQNDRAWYYLKHTMDSRSDYPEVSFTAISAIATGMMGIQPDAGANKVTTVPRLPTPIGGASEVANLELNNILIGTHSLKVKHEGNVKTTLTHNSGSASLTWEAQFSGTYANLIVNGTSQTASTKSINGTIVSYVSVTVPVGLTVVVDTGVAPPQQQTNLVINLGFESGSTNWSFTNGTGTATNKPHTGSNLAYLNAGTTNKVSQFIAISTNGAFTNHFFSPSLESSIPP